MLSNKVLSEKGGISITRIRRWVKEFLPPDSKATRRSGYTREYGYRDGWYVYLAGHIVTVTGGSFQNAKVIMVPLMEWMDIVGLVPDLSKKIKRIGIDAAVIDYSIYFIPKRHGLDSRYLLVEGDLERKNDKPQLDELGRIFVKSQKTSIRYWLGDIPETNMEDFNLESRFRDVPQLCITRLLRSFLLNVCGGNQYFRWLRFWKPGM